MKKQFFLVHQEARRRALQYVAEAPEGYVVEVKEPTRSGNQNSKFHAMCGDFDGLPWYGKARNADDWKTLLVSGHTVATGGNVEIVPGLEGEFVNIRESTSLMSKSRASSLIEYTLSEMAERAIA